MVPDSMNTRSHMFIVADIPPCFYSLYLVVSEVTHFFLSCVLCLSCNGIYIYIYIYIYI
jgi:hypothetical protein